MLEKKLGASKKAEGIDTQTILLLVSILIMIAFQVYSSIVGADPHRLVFSLPLICIVLVFLVFLFLVGKAEARMTQSLDRRLPQLQYLENKSQVDRETTNLAARANEFIVGTGGRSRNLAYLKAIEEKTRAADVAYWRLIYGEKITHELCQHLCSIIGLPNVMIGQVGQTGYGEMLVVESGVILALPVPAQGGLMGITIPNPVVAHRMFRYLMLIYPAGTAISEPKEVRALCETCGTRSRAPAH